MVRYSKKKSRILKLEKMAGVFRFSNAVSDIDKFIDTYKKIYSNFIEQSENGEYFDHSEAAAFLAQNGLATSLGAIGSEALARSTRDDKSRDPLYNQHKSYSEMFRMLGWYEPGSKKTNFKLSEFGGYIAEENNKEILKKLFCLNLLHIVSPNQLTNVKGNNVLRPFSFLLKLANLLDGCISRDEIILGVLACPDDTDDKVLSDTAEKIKKLRKQDMKYLINEIETLKKAQNIKSKDTLPNYTRFPISALKWSGWAEAKSTKLFYGKQNVKMLYLTDKGKELSDKLSKIPDIRYEFLEKYSEEERLSFIALSNLQKLEAVGFDLGDYESKIPLLEKKAEKIINDFSICGKDYLFFGYQEASRDDLNNIDNLLEQL